MSALSLLYEISGRWKEGPSQPESSNGLSLSHISENWSGMIERVREFIRHGNHVRCHVSITLKQLWTENTQKADLHFDFERRYVYRILKKVHLLEPHFIQVRPL